MAALLFYPSAIQKRGGRHDNSVSIGIDVRTRHEIDPRELQNDAAFPYTPLDTT